MSKGPRQPVAFSLDELSRMEADYVPGIGAPPALIPDAEPAEGEGGLPAPAAAAMRRRGVRWPRLLAAGVGGLALFAIGLAVDRLISDLFARNDALGWAAAAFAGLAAVAVVAIVVREVAGLMRIRRITQLHAAAAAAVTADDRTAARGVARQIEALYRNRPETARGRAALARYRAEIIDGRDLIALAEKELILPLDEAGRRLVLASAKRVAVVTAISPRAVIDLVFVSAEILRLIRRLATLYGGRPGTLGFFRLTRAAITHLAVTGGMAAGDSLVQQILGHGLAARLSARLGEGVVNGLLTARVGIAAIEVCRPLPFVNGKPPRLSEVFAELRRMGAEAPRDQ